MIRTYILSILLILPVLYLFSGCCFFPGDRAVYREAVAAVHGNRASSLLISHGRILGQEAGRGLNPLLDLYDRHRQDFPGCTVVDKVIGRAAAFIAVQGGARKVYGRIMSEPARCLLESHGIETEWGLLVPNILNRTRDDICPLEKAVIGMECPEEAMKAVRRCVVEETARAESPPR